MSPTLVKNSFIPDKQGLSLFKCNLCGGEIVETSSIEIPTYKFCPHCGVSFDTKPVRHIESIIRIQADSVADLRLAIRELFKSLMEEIKLKKNLSDLILSRNSFNIGITLTETKTKDGAEFSKLNLKWYKENKSNLL